MPVTPTYPGVYIEEIPSGVHTIMGVATSISAFVGRAKRGPVDDPVTINNFGDFERIFGGLWRESTLGYAVRDFFLNGGGQAIVVRLFNPTDANQRKQLAAAQAVAAAADGEDANAAAQAARAKAGEYPDEPAKSAAEAVAAAAEATRTRAGADAGSVKQAATEAAKNFEDAVQQQNRLAAAEAVAAAVDGADAKAAAQAARAKAGEYPDEPAKSAAEAVAVAAEAAAKPGALVGAVKRAAADKAMYYKEAGKTTKRFEVGNLVLEAASPGKWGANLRVMVDQQNISAEIAEQMGLERNDLFNLAIIDTSRGGRSERFLNLSVGESPRQVGQVLRDQSQLVRWISNGTRAIAEGADPVTEAQEDLARLKDLREQNRREGMQECDLKEAEARVAAMKKVAEAIGDGVPLTYNSFLPENGESEKKGLYALEKADLFNLLCIPPYLPGGGVDVALLAAAAAYCEKRRAMLLVDPPPGWTDKETAKRDFTAAQDDYPGVKSSNAAIFFPRIKQPDPLNQNAIAEFAPCGVVAGVFARIDAQQGVWKAPAGQEATLVGVPRLQVGLTDPENGELNPLGINCLRAFPIVGRVIWGARTLRGADELADEYKYIPVRRLALYIEESLYRGTKWAVFKPNDAPLWAQLRLNVGAFMHTLFRRHAFQGQSSREAYFVKCDKETTTQNDIDRGIVNVVVGFAPLKPAEFVIIKIQQIAGQIEV